jgi:hypothetical protein
MPDGPGHQRGIIQRAGAQHAIETFGHQVDATVTGRQLDLQLRMPRQESRQGRQYHFTRHGAGHVHPQLAAQGCPPRGTCPQDSNSSSKSLLRR